MAQEARDKTPQALIITGSWLVRIFDTSGNEVKLKALLVTSEGHFEVGQLPSKAVVATVSPYHYEDEYDAPFNAYRVRLYCYDGSSMRLVGIALVEDPFADITSYVRDALSHC
jgi:hypothetical protein